MNGVQHADDVREIHRSHSPEPDGTREREGVRVCRSCHRVVAVEGSQNRVTNTGVMACQPTGEPGAGSPSPLDG